MLHLFFLVKLRPGRTHMHDVHDASIFMTRTPHLMTQLFPHAYLARCRLKNSYDGDFHAAGWFIVNYFAKVVMGNIHSIYLSQFCRPSINVVNNACMPQHSHGTWSSVIWLLIHSYLEM